MIDLRGEVAAVTGAAGGIGAEVARTSAQAVARAVLGDVQASVASESLPRFAAPLAKPTCHFENITVADIQKLLALNATGVPIVHPQAVRVDGRPRRDRRHARAEDVRAERPGAPLSRAPTTSSASGLPKRRRRRAPMSFAPTSRSSARCGPSRRTHRVSRPA